LFKSISLVSKLFFFTCAKRVFVKKINEKKVVMKKGAIFPFLKKTCFSENKWTFVWGFSFP